MTDTDEKDLDVYEFRKPEEIDQERYDRIRAKLDKLGMSFYTFLGHLNAGRGTRQRGISKVFREEEIDLKTIVDACRNNGKAFNDRDQMNFEEADVRIHGDVIAFRGSWQYRHLLEVLERLCKAHDPELEVFRPTERRMKSAPPTAPQPPPAPAPPPLSAYAQKRASVRPLPPR